MTSDDPSEKASLLVSSSVSSQSSPSSASSPSSPAAVDAVRKEMIQDENEMSLEGKRNSNEQGFDTIAKHRSTTSCDESVDSKEREGTKAGDESVLPSDRRDTTRNSKDNRNDVQNVTAFEEAFCSTHESLSLSSPSAPSSVLSSPSPSPPPAPSAAAASSSVDSTNVVGPLPLPALSTSVEPISASSFTVQQRERSRSVDSQSRPVAPVARPLSPDCWQNPKIAGDNDHMGEDTSIQSIINSADNASGQPVISDITSSNSGGGGSGGGGGENSNGDGGVKEVGFGGGDDGKGDRFSGSSGEDVSQEGSSTNEEPKSAKSVLLAKSLYAEELAMESDVKLSKKARHNFFHSQLQFVSYLTGISSTLKKQGTRTKLECSIHRICCRAFVVIFISLSLETLCSLIRRLLRRRTLENACAIRGGLYQALYLRAASERGIRGLVASVSSDEAYGSLYSNVYSDRHPPNSGANISS